MRIPSHRTTSVVGIVAFAIVFVVLATEPGRAATATFTENFSTLTKRDAATTAAWSTSMRRVTLPILAPSWQAMSGLTGQEVSAVAFSPAFASDQTAFVGVANGIFRSTDGGTTWARVASIGAADMESIALSPAFASDRTGFAISNGNGIWRTTNGGTTWTKVHSAAGFAVAVSPAFASDRTVFAGTFARVYRSTDGGTTWTTSTSGMDSEVIENGDIRGVAVSSAYASDRTVYATTFSFGVYRSTDGGATWATANPANTEIESATMIAAGAGGRVAAAFLDGVYVTTDRGGTWSRAYVGDVNDVAFIPGTSTLLLATPLGAIGWRGGTLQLASGWPGGEARAIAASSSYPATKSIIGGWATGAAQYRTGYSPSAVAVSTPIVALADRVTRATLTPTVIIPSGTSVSFSLSVAKDADGKPIWEGPIESAKPWTFTSAGSELRWRISLATTDSAATPAVTALTITYDTAPAAGALTSPTPGTPESAPKSIRWKFTDTMTDETGFELLDSQGRVLVSTKPNSVRDFSYLDEPGLTPNTEYCGRSVRTLRNEDTSPASASYACVTTHAETPGALAFEVTPTEFSLSIAPGGNLPDTEYAIRETATNGAVGRNRSLGADDLTWQTLNAWGTPTLRVTGLSPNTSYAFCVVARNRAGVETPCSPVVPVRTPAAGEFRGAIAVTLRPPELDMSPATPGSTMSWLMAVENRGAGPALDVQVASSIPSGLAFLPGSLAGGQMAFTDARDFDTGDFNVSVPGAAAFRIPFIPPGVKLEFRYRTSVTQDAGPSIIMRVRATFRPLAGASMMTSDAEPVTLSVFLEDSGNEREGRDGNERESQDGDGEGEERGKNRGDAGDVEEALEGPDEGAEEGGGVGDDAALNKPEPGPVPEERGGGGGSVEPVIEITSPTDGITLNGSDAVVEGFTGIVGQTVEVFIDGVSIGGVQTDGSGSFAMTIRNLVPGQRTIVAKIVGGIADVRVVVPQPPVELVLTKPVEGAVLNVQSLIVHGRGPIGAKVSFVVDDAKVGEAVIDPSGNFIAAIATVIAEGTHDLIASAVPLNQESVEAGVAFTIDRTPPSAPTVTEIAVPMRVASPTVEGKLDVTFTIRGALDEEEFASLDALLITVSSDPITFVFKPESPNWEYTAVAPLEPGMHTVRVAARDLAGNVTLQPETLTFEVPPMECGDGIDNDGDTLIDYPKDQDCRSVIDDREQADGVIERAVTVVKETTTTTAKAVAKTTRTVAKATAKTAERAAVVVHEKVIENPVVQTTSELIVAPTVAVAVMTNTAATTAVQGFQLLTYLQYIGGMLLQPWRLLARRRRKQWGTVYDSLTKRPLDLATIRLIDAKTGKIVRSEVTDGQGRYGFIIERPGTYRIEVHRKGYAFPSALLKGKHEDAAFVDLYHGEEMTITGAILAMNIPLDVKERAEESGERAVRAHYLRLVSSGVSNAGLVLAFASFGITPRPFVGVILLLNIASYFFFRRLAAQTKRPKSWGAVTDAGSKEPLHLAVVRLFDEEYHKLLETTVTDRYGRYSFLVGKNVFDITAQKVGYESSKSKPIDHTKAEGIVAEDISLKPSSDSRRA